MMIEVRIEDFVKNLIGLGQAADIYFTVQKTSYG
jgi:hypothetical protein